jgi:hypothetical protein
VGFAAMKFLHSSKGVKFVIFTDRTFIHLLYNETHYWIKVDMYNLDYADVADILSAAFCCSYIKERDPLWAFCFATGAVHAALETHLTGLNKVPPKSKIEQNAYYHYGTVSFQNHDG